MWEIGVGVGARSVCRELLWRIGVRVGVGVGMGRGWG